MLCHSLLQALESCRWVQGTLYLLPRQSTQGGLKSNWLFTVRLCPVGLFPQNLRTARTADWARGLRVHSVMVCAPRIRSSSHLLHRDTVCVPIKSTPSVHIPRELDRIFQWAGRPKIKHKAQVSLSSDSKIGARGGFGKLNRYFRIIYLRQAIA